METLRRVATIRDQVKNFRDWYAELIAQIPETVEHRTNLSFIIFSLLSEESTIHIRSIMNLSFESYPRDFNLARFFDEIREKINKSHSVASHWRLYYQNGLYEPIKPWPEQRSISEAYDIKKAALSEELEKERTALRVRLNRINKAYSHLAAIEELFKVKRSLMRPKILFQARDELDEAIKLIRRKAGCTTFDADLKAFQKKTIEFINQPDIEIKFTYI